MHAVPLLPANAGPKSRPNCSTAYSQAVAMQHVLLADALKPETPPRERAQVARAWCELEERKRILKMKPKPRDVEVANAKQRRRRPQPDFAPESEPEMSEQMQATADA